MQLNQNRALTTVKRLEKKNNSAPLKTTQGTLTTLSWQGKSSGNPICCGARTYKLHYRTGRRNRVHAGYICRKCMVMIPLKGNGEEKQHDK